MSMKNEMERRYEMERRWEEGIREVERVQASIDSVMRNLAESQGRRKGDVDAPSAATGTEGEVCRDIAQRQAFGLNKYGVSVRDNPLSLRQWLEHLYQEQLDACVYTKRCIEEIDGQLRR